MSITNVTPASASDFGGIYDVPEAARYLKATLHASVVYAVSSAKLIRWIRRGIASPSLTDVPGRELVIAFEDLISVRVIAALRASGVKWSEIDVTEEWLRSETEHERPFATEFLWTGQGQIFVDWTAKLVSASRNGQLALGLLKDYLIPVHGLVFNADTHVATSWEPTKGIVLEPQVQFGSPCIKGTRIPTRTVSGMIEAGDSVDLVANSYQLSHDEIEAACNWEAQIQGVQSAIAA